MNNLKISVKTFLLSASLLFTTQAFSQDPNFYIYLCFGQSNMEGNAAIENQDKTVDERFRVMETIDCSNLNRTKGTWYTAVPPLCRCYTGLTPADYFGRTMVANLPDSIRVGVVNVSVAGCKIELFDKDNYQTYASTVESWMTSIINTYGGNPYAYLVEMAKLAQKDGVIKGILLHQGESNTGDSQWPTKVKGIYDNLISDLGLVADSIPILAGELVNSDQGGACSSMNTIIAKLPQTIPNSYVISSSGCTCASDKLHFTAEGYRKIGIRYGIKMLSLMGIEASEPEEPETPEGTFEAYYETECATMGENWEILADAGASNGTYVTVKAGIQSLTEAAGSEGTLEIPFSIDTTGTYKVFARLNCPTADDDSYWVKIDNGSFAMCNGLGTNGWQWMPLGSYDLTNGDHNLVITYREDGAKMDKICISNYSDTPTGMGETALNICIPDTGNVSSGTITSTNGFSLGQNYPNPVNGTTAITFEIPKETFVSLKVYNALGTEITELAGKNYREGKHSVTFNTQNLPQGIYIYTIQADNFSASQKMVIQSRK